jgi:hypothetical protein
MNNDMTYWSACVACLPPEKRASAERAFREIQEGGENGMWPRLFLLMEAHGLYVQSIPAKIVEAGEQTVARMREAAEARPDNGGVCKEDMDRLLGAIQKADARECIAATKSKTEEMAVEVTRLNRQVSRLRNLRVGAGLFIVCLMGLLLCVVYWGAGNWGMIQSVKEIGENGLQLRVEQEKDGVRVEVLGPNAEGNLLGPTNGRPGGVWAEFHRQ